MDRPDIPTKLLPGEFISPMHRAARTLAAAGIRVFPCVPNTKDQPLVIWQASRSDDPPQIDAWWTQWPDANLAVVPEDFGCAAFDLDVTGDGAEAWAELQREHGELPATRVHQTPSGGQHVILRGSAPPSVRRLGHGIDVRGRNSYILWPGSVIYGKPYHVVDDTQPAPMPEWLAELTTTPKYEPRKRADGLDDIAMLRAMSRALAQVALRISNGDLPHPGNRDRWYPKFLARMHGLGLPPETALEMMQIIIDHGGTAPDDWGGAHDPDFKTLNKVARIWSGETIAG